MISLVPSENEIVPSVHQLSWGKSALYSGVWNLILVPLGDWNHLAFYLFQGILYPLFLSICQCSHACSSRVRILFHTLFSIAT